MNSYITYTTWDFRQKKCAKSVVGVKCRKRPVKGVFEIKANLGLKLRHTAMQYINQWSDKQKLSNPGLLACLMWPFLFSLFSVSGLWCKMEWTVYVRSCYGSSTASSALVAYYGYSGNSCERSKSVYCLTWCCFLVQTFPSHTTPWIWQPGG